MRTIKFRAWVRETGKLDRMIYPGSDEIIVFSNNGIFVDSEAYAVMQFTGLLDKNGKEIYEGDILKWDTEGTIGKVFWWEAEAMFDMNPVANGFDATHCEQYEVIGNIYENPEPKL